MSDRPRRVTGAGTAAPTDDASLQLRQRVHELATLLDLLPIGIGIAADRDCTDIKVNPAFATTLGIAPDDNASLTAPESERPTNFKVVDLEGQEVRAEQLPMQVAAREGRVLQDVEYNVVHADGRVVRLLEYAAPLFDDEGQPRGAIGAFVDITERRRADERAQFLVRLDDGLRALSDPTAILALASELLGRQVGATRCAYAMVDPDQDHVVVPFEFAAADAGPSLVGRWRLSAFGQQVATTLRAGRTLVVEDVRRELPADADAFAALSVSATVCAPAVRDGRLTALMAVHQATPRRWHRDEVALVQLVADRCWESVERARAVRELRASRDRYRIMADAMPQLVWTAGADGVVDYVSARVANYGRLTAGHGDGDWQPIVHPDDLAPTRAAWRAAMTGPSPYAFEHRLQMASGDYRWHLSRAEPVQMADASGGSTVKWFGTATDIHYLRETQNTLRRQEERLLDADRRKDEFLAVLAHELRNPLAPLRAAVELLEKTGVPAETARRLAPVMQRQIGQMVRLIDDLLDVSRITTGRIQLQRQPTPLDALVQQAVDAHRATLDEAGVSLAVTLPPAPCWIDVDPARFVQILSNLVHNAVKFTPRDGSVRIDAALEPSEPSEPSAAVLTLSVVDSGVGIPATVLPGIFELFARAGEPGSQTGLGIGLALARQLVELHGGGIEAASDGPGRGARFTVRLPTRIGDGTAAMRELPPTAHRLDGVRVLVVDDNHDAAETLALVLADAGAEVQSASAGAGAIARVGSWRPAAVLLDLGMPGMDGYETCRALRRALGSAPPVAIVAVSGFGQEADKRRAAAAGFDAYLIKPATLAAIATALADLGVRPQPAGPVG